MLIGFVVQHAATCPRRKDNPIQEYWSRRTDNSRDILHGLVLRFHLVSRFALKIVTWLFHTRAVRRRLTMISAIIELALQSK